MHHHHHHHTSLLSVFCRFVGGRVNTFSLSPSRDDHPSVVVGVLRVTGRWSPVGGCVSWGGRNTIVGYEPPPRECYERTTDKGGEGTGHWTEAGLTIS